MKTIEAAASNISSNALCAANCMETEYGATTKAPVNTPAADIARSFLARGL
jgi:hypothetical protein